MRLLPWTPGPFWGKFNPRYVINHSSHFVLTLNEWKVFYFNTIPIRAEADQRLHPRRQVYRLKLETCQESHGLPTVVTIKGMKEYWHDEFQQEIEVYERFKMLQGSTIPTAFGQGTITTVLFSSFLRWLEKHSCPCP
jgi:hypothetical protein